MTDPAPADATTTGGDPVCWLDRLCPDCGAMPSADTPDRCWRCDRPWGPEPDPDPADRPHR